jgi:hypothetical protein
MSETNVARWNRETAEHESQSYNGWTNRETWALMLHVNNDEGLQQSVLDMLSNNPGWNRDDAVKDWAESMFTRAGYADEFGDVWPDALADIAGEIGSLWRVNWVECADSLTAE